MYTLFLFFAFFWVFQISAMENVQVMRDLKQLIKSRSEFHHDIQNRERKMRLDKSTFPAEIQERIDLVHIDNDRRARCRTDTCAYFKDSSNCGKQVQSLTELAANKLLAIIGNMNSSELSNCPRTSKLALPHELNFLSTSPAKIKKYAFIEKMIKQLPLKNKIYHYKDYPEYTCHPNDCPDLVRNHKNWCGFIVYTGFNYVDLGIAKIPLTAVQGKWRGVHFIKNGRQLFIRGSHGNTFIDVKTKEILRKTKHPGDISPDQTKLVWFADQEKKQIVIKNADSGRQINSFKLCYQLSPNKFRYGEHIRDPRFNADGTKIVIEFRGFNEVERRSEASYEVIDIGPFLKLEHQLNFLTIDQILKLKSIYDNLENCNIGNFRQRKQLRQKIKSIAKKRDLSAIQDLFLSIKRKHDEEKNKEWITV